MLQRIKGLWPKFSIELSSSEYKPFFETSEREYGQETVNSAIDQARFKFGGDQVPGVKELHDLMVEAKQTQNAPTTAHLYDDNCPNCMEGWEEIGFEQFSSKEKNQLIDLYGFEKSHTITKRRRCRLCWKGQQ